MNFQGLFQRIENLLFNHSNQKFKNIVQNHRKPQIDANKRAGLIPYKSTQLQRLFYDHACVIIMTVFWEDWVLVQRLLKCNYFFTFYCEEKIKSFWFIWFKTHWISFCYWIIKITHKGFLYFEVIIASLVFGRDRFTCLFCFSRIAKNSCDFDEHAGFPLVMFAFENEK